MCAQTSVSATAQASASHCSQSSGLVRMMSVDEAMIGSTGLDRLKGVG